MADTGDVFQGYARRWRESQARTYDASADQRRPQVERYAYYYGLLRRLLHFTVEEGKRVLCVRSDVGQYLDWVKPSRGVGIEVSRRRVEIARARYPQFEFFHAAPDLNEVAFEGTFDYILIPNGVNDIFDVQATFERLKPLCARHTRVVITFYNFLWQPLVVLAEKLGLKMRQPPQNWLTSGDLTNLLHLAGFEVVREYRSVLLPIYVPVLSAFLNEFLAPLPLLNRLGFVQALVARPSATTVSGSPERTVSVVIPCKNEKDNVEDVVRRTPDMGAHTEFIFCDDRSTDGTGEEVRRVQALYPDRDIRLLEGPGICKAENVWVGFEAARGDALMILDGDLAVPPEELPRFYTALVTGKGDFINGSRMVYPMEGEAMRLLNVFGNKMFSLLFSYILRQNLKDTLCGTKVFWRSDYERVKRWRGTWGITDHWGDYELIFGAAKCHLQIIDMPVHYMKRVHGETKMTTRFRTAAMMFRMCMAAYGRFRP